MRDISTCPDNLHAIQMLCLDFKLSNWNAIKSVLNWVCHDLCLFITSPPLESFTLGTVIQDLFACHCGPLQLFYDLLGLTQCQVKRYFESQEHWVWAESACLIEFKPG